MTHYHLAGRPPFLNLSDLQPGNADGVLAELNLLAGGRRSHRRFGPKYLTLRTATEELLRERFVARGGRPERRAPHYFVLGESAWFRGLYADCAEIRVALQQLPAKATSITWPDSVASMGLLNSNGHLTGDRSQDGRVFLLEELPDVVDRYGLPDSDVPDSYDGHQHQAFDHFIEVQLWSDEPLRRLGL